MGYPARLRWCNGEENFGVGGLAVSDCPLGILHRRLALALHRVSSRTHPGALGEQTSRARRREDGVSGRSMWFRRALEAGIVTNTTEACRSSITRSSRRHVPAPSV